MEAAQIGQLHGDLSQYEAGLVPDIPNPPQTIVVECNKTQSVQDGDALRTNAWTNSFPAIKLKRGDIVSVNSAFLSTRGAGDLLQFDETNDQTRAVFEYYATNDNANNKRPDFNIKGSSHPDVAGAANYAYTYDEHSFTNCYPANYRPMRLQRLAETYQTRDDFATTVAGHVTFPTIPEFTDPTLAKPFYSPQKEKYWGYRNSVDYILDAVEDKYVDGLFRPPQVAVREMMTYCSKTGGTPDPRDTPFFGLPLDDLRIWYVSTPMSKYGPAGAHSTMRIYFVYGQETDFAGRSESDQQIKDIGATATILKYLRVGEVIQFKQPSYCFGDQSIGYQHYLPETLQPGVTDRLHKAGGSNAFYCNGYVSQSDGITVDGVDVDRFVQVGAVDSVDNMTVKSVMGQFMRIIKINYGNSSDTNKTGSMPTGHSSRALYDTPGFFDTLPWIDVQCDKGMSIAYNNPNYEHPEGIPAQTMKNTVDSISYPMEDDLAAINRSQLRTIQLRCWTAGKSYNNTVRSALVASPGLTQRTDMGVVKNGLYPINPQETDGKQLSEKFYVAFRPYYMSRAGVDPADFQNSSYSMRLNENEVPTAVVSQAKYTDALGLTATNPKVLAHNYNFSNLNRDGTLDTVSDGYDIVSTDTYCGARTPQFWNDAIGNSEAGYTEPIQDVRRIGIYNQGEEYWQPEESNNITGTGGFYTNNAGLDAGHRLTNNQSTLSPNTDLYLKNEKGNNMMFYFTEKITANGTAFAGTAQPEWDLSTTIFANRPDGMKNGGNYNLIIGIKNMIRERYIGGSGDAPSTFTASEDASSDQKVIKNASGSRPQVISEGMYVRATGNVLVGIIASTTAATVTLVDDLLVDVKENDILTVQYEGPLIPQSPDNGIFYGFTNQEGNGFNKPATSETGDGPDKGIADLRFPFMAMNTEVYARFTNKHGQQEIMYIKICPQSIQYCGSYNNIAAMNTGTPDYGLAGFEPSVVQGTQTPGSTQQCAVAMFIIQRDVQKTGQWEFDGTLNTDTAFYGSETSKIAADLKPNEVSARWDTPAYSYYTKGCYFEILNGYASSEHLFSLESTGRDLLPIGHEDLTQNETYLSNFNNPALGTPCGGDFYLCKHANMPSFDNTNTIRMVDDQLRLSTLTVKKGQPDRTEDLTSQHTGKYQWVTHYDYIDLSLNGEKVYFSPTDIANLITKQLHAPADLYKSYVKDIKGGGGRFEGGYWKNTAGKYPMNSLFRTIHGPSHVGNQDPASGQTPSGDGDANLPDAKTGMLTNPYHDGDFVFELDMTHEVINNGINAYGWNGSQGMLKGYDDNSASISTFSSGKHKCWIGNQHIPMNTIPSTDSYQVKGYANTERVPGGFIRTFMDDNNYRTNPDFLINLKYGADATFGPMFIGTNNAQLSYNTDVSRFEWKFLHQPVYSEFSSDPSGASSGGNVVAKIFAQSVQGYDNWDRYGGVNMVNWAAAGITRGKYTTRRESTTTDPLTKTDTIGNAFMNKLGFSNAWMATNSGSKDYDDVQGYAYKSAYEPLGTTRSDYDVSEARPYTQTNAIINQTRDVNGSIRTAHFADPTDAATKLSYLQNDTTKISLGGLAVLTDRTTLDGAAPFGIEVTGTGPDLESSANVTIKELGATLGYGMVNTLATPQAVIYQKSNISGADPGMKVPTDLNMDDVKFPNYEIEVDSSSLLADELPKKTLIGYFLIMSDIIDRHEFIGSANGGQPLNCIGILSKNYENNDFYYSFQSPVEFHIKKDRTITSIRTVINTPDIKDPAGLDYNSSIIYTIVRQQSLPEPDVPPLSVQQALDYETMEQMSNQLGIDMTTFNPQSDMAQMGMGNPTGGSPQLNSLRQSLVSAVLNPNQNSASRIASTESIMASVVARMPLHERVRALQAAGMGDPADALKPSLAEAAAEGLGIGQPVSLEPEPYLSEQQLMIQASNLMKGNNPGGTPSESGDSIDDFIGPGGKIPMDAGLQDDDMMSLKSAMTKDTELYSVMDPTVGSGSGGLQESLSLPVFFQKYMSIANEDTRQYYRNESNQHGFSVDNPNVWRLGMLRTWAGKNNEFDWGNGLLNKIGGKLNLEAKSNITRAKDRYEALTPREQKAQRAKELMDVKQRGKDPTSSVIPEPQFGRESLIKRISRSQPHDPATRHDEKDIRATDFTNQNPYDLRTWSIENLKAYQGDTQHGVNPKSRSPATKLNEKGMNYLRQETTRRKVGNLRRLQLNAVTGLYKTTSQQPTGYDPQSKHLRPHISTGETVITPKKRGTAKQAPAPPKQAPPPPPPPQPQAQAPDPTPAPT